MARRMSTDEKVFTTLAVGAGGLLLYYLLSGAGSEKNARLIPDSIEGRLDAVVDALNAKLGREWVNYGIHVLEAALSKALPPSLTALISIVYQAEQIGFQRRLSGPQKRMVAVQMVRASARA